MRELGFPFSLVTMYDHIEAGRIKVKKCGRNLLITTSPAEFLASLPSTLGRAPRRRARAS
jgi:hypothetical protein